MIERHEADLVVVDGGHDGSAGALRQVGSPAELAAAREDLGLSQQEVASHFRLRTSQLDALERGEWESLPGKAYSRALIRAYARLVNVDAAPLLSAVGGFAEPSELRPSMDAAAAIPAGAGEWDQRRGRLGSRSSSKAWIYGVAAFAGLAVIAILATVLSSSLSVQQASGDGSRVVAVPIPGVTSQAGQTAAPAPAAPVAISTPLDQKRLIGVGGAAVQAEAPAPTVRVSPSGKAIAEKAGSDVQPFVVNKLDQAVLTAPASSSSATAASNEAPALSFPVKLPPTERVRLKISKPTWIEVWHKDDQKLLYGTQKPAGWVTLDGVPPMRVVIGNPRAVQVEFRGEPVDMSDKMRRGVARFVLN